LFFVFDLNPERRAVEADEAVKKSMEEPCLQDFSKSRRHALNLLFSREADNLTEQPKKR
jgi:hypothetical protein